MSALAAQLLPKVGDLVAGRYRVDSVLGKGGMGAVYRATHQGSGRPVAVKWMLPSAAADESAIERFLAEARTMARIDHPNVVGILDMGENGGAPFLVMELLWGESLRQRLDKRKRLGVSETVDILLPAMRGVAEAHREGVVHRDLKPDNIFLCQSKDGRPREAKVVDFGISKLAEHSSGAAPVTKTGIAIGTPGYMAPEQLNAPKFADPRFDVYAMGIVLYECLTGRPPYHAEGLLELLSQIAAGRPTPPSQLAPEIPPALEEIVLTSMRAQIDERFASMDDLIHALEHVRPALPVGAAATALTPSGFGARTLAATQQPLAGSTPSPAQVPGSGPVLRGPHGTTPLPDHGATPWPAQAHGAEPVERGLHGPTPPGQFTPQPGAWTASDETQATPQPAGMHSPEPARSVRWVIFGGAALAMAAASALALGLGFWVLGGSEPEPRIAARAAEPAARIAGPPAAPLGEPASDATEPASAPAEPAAPSEPSSPTYAEVTADLGAHSGARLSLAGVVAHVEGGPGAAFVVFVAEPGCGGARACALRATGASPAPPVGQAVRVHGRLEGSHRYRTRGGTDREIPQLAVERLELLIELEATAVDEAERPPEGTRAPAPPRGETPRPLSPAPGTPRPLALPVSPPPTQGTFRPVVSSDEI